MDLRIEDLPPKILIGKKLVMSFANNRTPELWKAFMPLRNTIVNTVSNDLYSLQVYPAGFFNPFNPLTLFEKWALREVSNAEKVPAGMEVFNLPGGLYVVFNYIGSFREAPGAFQYIMGEWLPQSDYMLDDRPHFELLGEKYKNDDPASEEEIWIPVKLK